MDQERLPGAAPAAACALPVDAVRSPVKARYARAAGRVEADLCCPVDYDGQYLAALPAEVIEKDYGCGDPSRWLRAGDTVLDLGSGAGKICFIAAQVVGPQGKVIGVDMTEEMLEVACRNAPLVAEHVGYSNVEFRKGHIQDLALDLEWLEEELRRRPCNTAADYLGLEQRVAELRRRHPLVADASVDAVVSNCVLNLVDSAAKPVLFREVFRVLRPGGRAVIADIVSDKPVPAALRQDPELWSGCISGALTEAAFTQAFADAGFATVECLQRAAEPWRVVDGIQFRSMTLRAWKQPGADRPMEAGTAAPGCCAGAPAG